MWTFVDMNMRLRRAIVCASEEKAHSTIDRGILCNFSGKKGSKWRGILLGTALDGQTDSVKKNGIRLSVNYSSAVGCLAGSYSYPHGYSYLQPTAIDRNRYLSLCIYGYHIMESVHIQLRTDWGPRRLSTGVPHCSKFFFGFRKKAED